MRKILLTILCLMAVFIHTSYAQNTLPDITVRSMNGKVIISWKNNYGEEVSNINIQRSTDSLKNFATITSVLSPSSDENGVVDPKPLKDYNKMYYRVFVAFEGGSYLFSKSYRPVPDTEIRETVPFISLLPSLDSTTTEKLPKKIPPVVKKPRAIYTGKDNNIIMNLPDALTHKYSIRFYNDSDNLIFKIDKIANIYLILDKANFIHSGWFHYQLYDGDQVIEKNTFFIPKDFKTPNAN
jgi:hypothetical protein